MIVLKSTTETQAFDFIPREYVPSLDPIYKVSIFSEIQNKEIILKISHNGQGITNQEFEVFANNSNGLGLNSMQSLFIILNGKLCQPYFRLGNKLIVRQRKHAGKFEFKKNQSNDGH